MIRPADDGLHDPGGRAHWRESAGFPISLPDRLVGGWVLLTHRPALGLTVAGLALWDPTGAHPHDCLYHDWGEPYAFDPAWDVLRCVVPNGLTAELLEPLGAVHLSYLRDECQADLTWAATGEPVATRPGGGGDPGGGFAQPGRLTGTIALRGEILHVDCASRRDRGWGPAPPRGTRGPAPRSDAPWALDEAGDGFGLWATATAEVAHDRLHGTTERVRSGWHRAGGVTRPLRSGTRRVLERAADGRPLRVRVRAVDDRGRELVADGECVNGLRWPGRPGTHRWWCLTRWRVGGRAGWGEVREDAPLELTRRWHRERR